MVYWNKAQINGTPVMSGTCAKPFRVASWKESYGRPPDSYEVSSGSAGGGFNAAAADAKEFVILRAIRSHTSGPGGAVVVALVVAAMVACRAVAAGAGGASGCEALGVGCVLAAVLVQSTLNSQRRKSSSSEGAAGNEIASMLVVGVPTAARWAAIKHQSIIVSHSMIVMPDPACVANRAMNWCNSNGVR